jgi:hypothetical protein
LVFFPRFGIFYHENSGNPGNCLQGLTLLDWNHGALSDGAILEDHEKRTTAVTHFKAEVADPYSEILKGKPVKSVSVYARNLRWAGPEFFGIGSGSSRDRAGF